MRLSITIDMGNDSFGTSAKERGNECICVLAKALEMLAHDGAVNGEHLPLFDTNGNRVGELTIAEAA